MLDLSLNRRAQSSDQSIEDLRQTLHLWRQALLETQSAARQNALDLAVLIEPIAPLLAQIHRKQQQQDERQAKLDERLAKLEAGMNRVTAALPWPVSKEDGRQVQPRLAGRDDLASLPAKIWEAKPSMFGKN
jgi:septal ring factor EnvC (AmiA/AmiB activator)